MSEPKLSIIIPVYNTEKYLQRCFDSVISQSYKDFEVIVVDDGSTDHSSQIIEEYTVKYGFISVFQSNRGVGAARNKGVSFAKGDYITFIDSDDFIYPDYCSYLLEIMGDADIAVTGREKYDNDTHIKTKVAPRVISADTLDAVRFMLSGKYNAHPAWGKILKREIVEKVSFIEDHIFEEIRYSLDTMLAARKVVFSDRVLYSYRMHEGSILTSNTERQLKDYLLSAEYVYQTLSDNNLFDACRDELKIFLAKGIARNTMLFCKSEVDVDLYKNTSARLTDLYYSIGGL